MLSFCSIANDATYDNNACFLISPRARRRAGCDPVFPGVNGAGLAAQARVEAEPRGVIDDALLHQPVCDGAERTARRNGKRDAGHQ